MPKVVSFLSFCFYVVHSRENRLCVCVCVVMGVVYTIRMANASSGARDSNSIAQVSMQPSAIIVLLLL